MFFKCYQPGHMLRNSPISNVASIVNKFFVTSSSAPTPRGVASVSISTFGADIGWNPLYALTPNKSLRHRLIS